MTVCWSLARETFEWSILLPSGRTVGRRRDVAADAGCPRVCPLTPRAGHGEGRMRVQKRRVKAPSKVTDLVSAELDAIVPTGLASPNGAFPIVGIGASAGG